jgi:hypothetical protein
MDRKNRERKRKGKEKNRERKTDTNSKECIPIHKKENDKENKVLTKESKSRTTDERKKHQQ